MEHKAPLQELEGTLSQLLYVNAQSNYAVGVLRLDDPTDGRRQVIIVGDLGLLEVGAGVRIRGRIENHPRYGEQFRVDEYETLRPAGAAAIERYLASEIRGVGPALARRIAEHFGERLERVLDEEPARLREVRGLGPVVAARIAAAWRDTSGLRELTVFLRGHGIASVHALRIHRAYGRDSLAVIRRDPYLLARTIKGIGFRTADTVAEKLNIPRNSIERARGAILYLLERMAEEGHVYVPASYLEHQFQDALEMDPELVQRAVGELCEHGDLVTEPLGDTLAVYLRRLHEAEVNVARRLRLLSAGPAMGRAVIERSLGAARRALDFALSPEQERAVRSALESRVTVITGGPGTGKTTILRALVAALKAAGLRPTLAAPTGRGARRLAEACGEEARTIHRLLEYSPESATFLRSEQFPLRAGYLIVDEASMLDLELASSLLAALRPGAALLLVGDRDQLPSVGPGSVLKDVIASGLVPVMALTQVYRQARQSLIVANAHRINRGEMPELSNEAGGDFFFFERNAPEEVLATIKQLVRERLVGRFGISDPREIQVLTPMNRGPLGVHLMNDELQELLNPSGVEIAAGARRFRQGDRVIQTRNDYERNVFNGAIGRVIAADREKGSIRVAFEDTEATYEAWELDGIAPAYAISVHKSQGSQYPAVVMPVHQTHYLMLRRNLLYTAITRAERVCVLVGTKSALAQAVRNADERRRMSRLSERLRID